MDSSGKSQVLPHLSSFKRRNNIYCALLSTTHKYLSKSIKSSISDVAYLWRHLVCRCLFFCVHVLQFKFPSCNLCNTAFKWAIVTAPILHESSRYCTRLSAYNWVVIFPDFSKRNTDAVSLNASSHPCIPDFSIQSGLPSFLIDSLKHNYIFSTCEWTHKFLGFQKFHISQLMLHVLNSSLFRCTLFVAVLSFLNSI